MSVSRVSLRRHILSRRNDSKIAQKLEFLAPPDFDGEDSCFHDHDNSIDSSDPNSSPSAGSERYDEPSSDYLDIDFPCTPSPIFSSPCPMRKTRTLRSRKLQLCADDDGEAIESRIQHSDSQFDILSCASPSPVSPPHRKLRALRLFDIPQTPKTLLEKANKRTSSSFRPRRTRKCTNSAEKQDRPQANVNPFTPDNVIAAGCKRARTESKRPILDESTESELEDEVPTTKKIALHEINTSRYNEEFHEVCKLGDGEFGSVHNCVHRLDGCTYAIKKSKAPVAGSIYERTAMNEVYAHAVLGKHRHVVRYYSAWAENDYMYIQNEFCNGGSLADLVEERRKSGRKFSEAELKTLLFQLAKGVKYIHSQNLVHLDIKPGNVFIHRDPKYSSSAESGLDSCDEDTDEQEDGVTYKIGDLGHVTSCTNPMVEDGDCRYLPREILDENYDSLTKADIFSLGLTVYELACGTELPKNGDEWHALREGELPYLPQYSVEFNSLLKSMVSTELSLRPSAANLLQDSQLCPQSRMTREQLRRELNQERFKNQMLAKQLMEATRCLQERMSLPQLFCTSPLQLSTTPHLPTSLRNTPRTNHHRLIGGRLNRSLSMTLL